MANILFKGHVLTKCIGYTGSGWYEYADALINNGYLVGIHYYRCCRGWAIDNRYECLYEFADDGDWIVSSAELARDWISLEDLSDYELARIADEVD